MAKKGRMIDPLLWEDEDFGALTDKAKILFISCFSNADDEGRLSANLSNLKAMAFRFEEMTNRKVDELLKELQCALRNFKVYQVDNHNYIQLLRWKEYQKIRIDRFTPSKIPPYDNVLSTDNQLTTKPQPTDNQLSTNCQPDGSNFATQVKLSKVKLSKDNISSNDFEMFWNIY
ncbi:MAG: hypothetical protein DDT41_01511 [candidate division WS2 bacterium]|nr:hypothetical protein [Candidatus Psychracetigena formicireducens]